MSNPTPPTASPQPGTTSRPIASALFTLSSLVWPAFYLYTMAFLPHYLADEPGGDIYYIEYLPSAVAYAVPTGIALLPLMLWRCGASRQARLYAVGAICLVTLLGLYSVGFRASDIWSMESTGQAAMVTSLYFAILAISASRVSLVNLTPNKDPRFSRDRSETRKLRVAATCLALITATWVLATCGLLVGHVFLPAGLVYVSPLAAFAAALAGVNHWAWHRAAKSDLTHQAAWGSVIGTTGTLILIGLGLGFGFGFILSHESPIFCALGVILLTAFAGVQTFATLLIRRFPTR